MKEMCRQGGEWGVKRSPAVNVKCKLFNFINWKYAKQYTNKRKTQKKQWQCVTKVSFLLSDNSMSSIDCEYFIFLLSYGHGKMYLGFQAIATNAVELNFSLSIPEQVKQLFSTSKQTLLFTFFQAGSFFSLINHLSIKKPPWGRFSSGLCV